MKTILILFIGALAVVGAQAFEMKTPVEKQLSYHVGQEAISPAAIHLQILSPVNVATLSPGVMVERPQIFVKVEVTPLWNDAVGFLPGVRSWRITLHKEGKKLYKPGATNAAFSPLDYPARC